MRKSFFSVSPFASEGKTDEVKKFMILQRTVIVCLLHLMTIDINRYQSISINRLILTIDGQPMAKITWLSIGIGYQYQSITKLVSIGFRLAETELTHNKTLCTQ